MADQKPSRPEASPAEAGEPTGPGKKHTPKPMKSADFEISYVREGAAVYRVTKFTDGPRAGTEKRSRVDGPDGTLPEGVEV